MHIRPVRCLAVAACRERILGLPFTSLTGWTLMHAELAYWLTRRLTNQHQHSVLIGASGTASRGRHRRKRGTT